MDVHHPGSARRLHPRRRALRSARERQDDWHSRRQRHVHPWRRRQAERSDQLYRVPAGPDGGGWRVLGHLTNIIFNTEGDKTKMMAMTEGDSDITTNDRRLTIEKRGNPAGAVA